MAKKKTSMHKNLVQEQFGANAAKYATSKVHAKGASLGRLVELVEPQSDWQVLDVATAAGHTAFAFAPHVAHVIASDITPAMLPVAAQQAAERGIDNISFETADAENLPFSNDKFDLVTCRIAAHHFPHINHFMAEAARVLRPGGILAIVDNIAPGSRLRGKKARLQNEAGAYYNAFEALRDPSHHQCLSLDAWTAVYQNAGFTLQTQEIMHKWLDFDAWTSRMQVSPANTIRLRAMLLQAPEKAADFLTPQLTGARISFRLIEAILIGKISATD